MTALLQNKGLWMYLARLLPIEVDGSYDLICLKGEALGLITLYVKLDLIHPIPKITIEGYITRFKNLNADIIQVGGKDKSNPEPVSIVLNNISPALNLLL
jgi:hypothetical protein